MSTTAVARPRLRGWSHAAATPFAAAAGWLLWRSVGNGVAQRISVVVFAICLVGLFGVSSLYHVPDWDARVRNVLRRFDVAMIMLFIAGSFTPIGVHALNGTWRTWSLVLGWIIAIVGAAVAASPIRGPRWLTAAGYLAFGWLGVIPLARIMTALPWQGVGLIALGGACYTVGAVIYARRSPDPWPRWFGYHEVFHLLVLAGGTAHYLAVWRYVLPMG